MFDYLKKILGADEPAMPETPQDIQQHDVRIAACALFLEMAKIDDEFSDSEHEAVLAILKDTYNLSEQHAAAITEAAEEELNKSIDLWTFTNMINENFTEDEKIEVVELLWEIVYSDGKLDKHEDYLVHKLAGMLHLRHDQLIEAKLRILHKE